MADLDFTERALIVALPIIIGAGFVFPDWIVFLFQVSMASGLAALGVMLQMRAGLVSFGQGLYFCIGGYAAGLAGQFLGLTDVFALLALGVGSASLSAAALGVLMARYRDIFYAMLSLALSMILYGLLVKAEVLGSTDGFNLPHSSFLGWTPGSGARRDAIYILTCILTAIAVLGLHRYLRSPLGLLGEALRGNEIRLEYLGANARLTVHIIYVIAAGLAGLGGVLSALAVGHVDPDMAYWTTSGQFVFVVLLSGMGHVAAPLAGTFLLELLRIYAVEISANTWQLILGTIMLLIISFLPAGLGSLFQARKDREP